MLFIWYHRWLTCPVDALRNEMLTQHVDDTRGIAKGNEPESIFAVMSGTRHTGAEAAHKGCCFDCEPTSLQPVASVAVSPARVLTIARHGQTATLKGVRHETRATERVQWKRFILATRECAICALSSARLVQLASQLRCAIHNAVTGWKMLETTRR